MLLRLLIHPGMFLSLFLSFHSVLELAEIFFPLDIYPPPLSFIQEKILGPKERNEKDGKPIDFNLKKEGWGGEASFSSFS